jgi:hypothetical protein
LERDVSFEAKPGTIRAFGQEVRALSSDADAARDYAQQWLGLGYSEGRMFATVVETAESVRSALTRSYSRLGELASASSTELARSADHYEASDESAASRLRTLDPGRERSTEAPPSGQRGLM